jgi:uncharacterized damage-inducible protein DinB
MAIREALLPEFDHEMANTRKTLERIPEDKLGWKPHEKSMTFGRLAGHLAELPGWAVSALDTDQFDMAPPGQPPVQPANAASAREVLEMFDKNVANARKAIAAYPDEHFVQSWSLLAGGKTLMTMPRIAVIRTWVLSHNIHHRAQLGVYLRLNDIPVPAVYGPSADDRGM